MRIQSTKNQAQSTNQSQTNNRPDRAGTSLSSKAPSLLDYRTTTNPHPDVVPLIDTHKQGWKGLNTLFGKIASQSFQEALTVYRAAWRRGLTTPEIDKLAFASAVGERYDHGYWLKEKIFREIRARIQQSPLEKELTRLYYTGQFDEYARHIAEVPAR